MKRLNAACALVALALAPAGCEGATTAGAPSVTVSSPGAYWKAGTVRVKAGPAPDVTIVEDAVHQEVDGFGGAFNEQGWDALSVLGETERERALRLLFGSSDGARFLFGRVPIGASDYALDRYTLDDVAGDYALRHFSIERDRRLLIPYVRAALVHQPALWLWASAWTPPPWMKTNNAYDSGSMRDDPATLDAYAIYLARFVEAYRAEGLSIQAVHVQNEPFQLTRYPSCFWSPELIRDFVRGHLGPTFAARQVPAGIWLGTFNTEDPRYPNVALADAGARRHLRGIGVQWGALPLVPQLAASHPDLPLMQTETPCGNNHWEPGFQPDRPPNDHAYGEFTWGRILAYLRAGVRSYMAWNMVLDTEGKNIDAERPWPQNALLVVDRAARRLSETPAYWAFRHYSAFVDAGARRLGTTGADDETIAFRNPDGAIVIALQNARDQPRKRTLGVRGTILEIELPAHGWATIRY